MSKICLVEVGKFLGILKSQLCFKCLKIANGPHFLPRIIIQRLCTTIWPKGDLFYHFLLFIWIIITINSFNEIKYDKNRKPCFLIPFCSIFSPIKPQDSCTPNLERFGHDWYQKHMEKIWKYFIKDQILDSSKHGSLGSNFNPNPLAYLSWS